MNKKLFILSLVMSLCAMQTSNVIAWENDFTHPAITDKAMRKSDLIDDYLKTLSKHFLFRFLFAVSKPGLRGYNIKGL